MAQFEQKTDSREFEIANPDQSSGPGSGFARADGAVDIALRIWCSLGSSHSGPLTWNAESVFVYMIADLVTASGGRLATDLSGIMAAHFSTSGQALVAARRVQTSILEFLACRSGEGFGAAILIRRPFSGNNPGLTAEAARQALGLAKAGQILLDQEVSGRLRDLPGVQFRDVAPLASVTGTSQTGLQELVWTTPERAALLQAAVSQVAEPSLDASLPVAGATAVMRSTARDRGQTGQVVPPKAGTDDYVFKDGSAASFQPAGQARADSIQRIQEAEGVEGSPNDSLLEGLDEPRAFFTGTRVVIGAVALVLVGAMIALVYLPTGGSRRHVSPEPNQAVGEERPTHTQAPPSPPAAKVSRPEPKATDVPKAPAVALKVPPHPKPPAPVDKADKGSKDQQVKPEETVALGDYAGVSQRDIPRLLQMAQNHAGAGEYEKAQREYRVILQLQPNNQDAKEGLRRINLIQNSNQ